jgi:hypothetical protein
MIHPLTNHDCLTPLKDPWPLPDGELNIKIYQPKPGDDDYDGNDTVWLAEVFGDLPPALANGIDGEKVSWITYGHSRAHAALMAADIIRLTWEECLPEPHEINAPVGVPHCFCRDCTMSISDTGPTRAVACCRCEEIRPCSEFRRY